MTVDLIIIGGGPAGLATAIYARTRGLECVVLDKRKLPLDKACGEGLMPPGVRALEEMGVELPAGGSAPLGGIRYVDGDTVAEGSFGDGEGRGIRRTVLIAALWARAEELGAELHYGTKVDDWREGDGDGDEDRGGDAGIVVESAAGTLRGRYLIAADGLHSPTRRRLGLEVPWPGRPRFGVRRHFEIEPWAPMVEVHWADDCEAYVTPVGPRCVGVAMLFPGDGRSFDELLSRFPTLEDRFAGASFASSKRGGGPFRQRARRRVQGRVALVGDAAGYLDAITGEGVMLGFKTARAVVEAVARGDLASYDRAYRELSKPYYRMTEILLAVGARPGLRRRMVRMLAANPEIFGQVLAINVGDLPLRGVGARGFLRMLRGLV